MSSLALEVDQALQRLDQTKAARLERLLRDSLALALAEESDPAAGVTDAKNARRELFARRFAPLASIPNRDLSDVVAENRGAKS